jgi:UDP-N-acetylmuramate dehydrogenase
MLPGDWLRRFDGTFGRERVLAPLTTWRIGGPAQLYLEPASPSALSAAVRELRRRGLPYRMIGGGSNLLVADRGVRCAVLSLGRMRRIEAFGARVTAEAGAPLHEVVREAARRGLAGAERLAGIPGQVGGAIFGNAGGKYGAIGDLVRGLDVLDDDGEIVHVVPGRGFFRYRGSDVGGRIVVRAHLAFEEADPRAVRERSVSVIRERRLSQPGFVGNAGCVFKNPPNDSAGRLIDTAGCKGLREGGVHVSPIHANFFQNDGSGSEGDVCRLVDRVRERVRQVHGVELEMEVRRWP